MFKEDDSFLEDEPIEFKGGTLSISTEEDNANEHTFFLNPRKSRCTSLTPWSGEDPKSFFCYRDELVMKSLTEVREFLMEEDSNDIQGVWLLTEISFWDNERERIIALTRNHLVVIKYDFIASKILSHYKVPLKNIDTLTVGDLVYPSRSIAPHIEGITSGVMHVLKICAFKMTGNSLVNFNSPRTINESFSSEYFKARSRNVTGVRPMWNNGEPLKFSSKWNPFTNNIPWSTFMSHPLLWYKNADEERLHIFDVDHFVSRLVRAVQQIPRQTLCQIQQKPIQLQNYVGVLSIIHNRNGLGFFKVRGKFSF